MELAPAMMIQTQTLPTFAATGSFPFQLTQQQQKALLSMWTFIQPTAIAALFLLVGYAGTGKSTIVFQLVKVLVAAGKRVVLTAPTNKAVGVLQRMAAENGVTGVEFFTIHQLLGLGMVTRGKEKVLDQTGPSYINLFDVVFIDECSMIGKQLWRWIEDVANQSSTWTKIKIILMGDPAQLNPVNEGKSPSFQVPDKAVLTQVVRQGTGSPLLEFVTASRYAVTKSKFPFEPYAKYLPDKSNGALMVKRQTLLRYACKKMKREFAQNPDCFRILSWTNTQVDFYNQQIRTHLYGENINRFIPGERLITRDPVMAPDGKTTILAREHPSFCKERENQSG
ncbi:ATP-dependent DNA helicase [Nostoc favosum]|uniref:AAA family ATPase n=1 Tax=Nostoc favosum CHAB5714 TaxID=2780399 RepID=A0ABS8IE30_9NOSO|nr:AAA family ATPase [Nostoc favosum]MCC5602447.1 AAA family ATPase [Nostoc favosum CHAB5714]